jgi:hypothetical protein
MPPRPTSLRVARGIVKFTCRIYLARRVGQFFVQFGVEDVGSNEPLGMQKRSGDARGEWLSPYADNFGVSSPAEMDDAESPKLAVSKLSSVLIRSTVKRGFAIPAGDHLTGTRRITPHW